MSERAVSKGAFARRLRQSTRGRETGMFNIVTDSQRSVLLRVTDGTITSAILKRMREDHNNIPVLNIAYEGQQDSQTLTRLEAFLHQAKVYQQAKKF